MKDLTIGITITIKDDKENIWNNGITQNVVNFALLLKNSLNNYNVVLVAINDNKLEYNLEGIEIYNIKEKRQELDILFILGTQILEEDYIYLKNKGCKIVYYCCGSNYILDMEQVLFNSGTTAKLYRHIPDQIWVIPQNYNTNHYYFETLYRKETLVVPFIWSPTFIDYILKGYKMKGTYTPSFDLKRLATFEPNINVVKYTMYNIIIAEQVHRERPDLIKHFYITNSDNIKTNPLFIDLMQQFDIVKNGIATFENRFRMPYFLDTYTDIVLAHQWENPLNYAYLEALYLEYPLVHNASMIKDAGYYYEGFDVKTGKQQLIRALTEHDRNADVYNRRSKRVIERYLPTNSNSIETYDKMIDNLFKK